MAHKLRITGPPSETTTLIPGTYCGGISIHGGIKVRLRPGIYIIKDGPFEIGGNSTVRGRNVGFYFSGKDAVFDFSASSQISLTAPT
jgi:hypothetical protein